MEKPKIGIVTPVYNGEEYIEKTIKSILAQSFKHWEHVIIDGKSTDKTVAIVKKYSESDSRIKLISETDEGMYDALIKALDRINAPICSWINADDIIMPRAFELVTHFMIKKNVNWVTGIPAKINKQDMLYILNIESIPVVSGLHWILMPLWYPQQLIRAGLFHGRALGWIQQEGTFFKTNLYRKIDRKRLSFIRKQHYAGDFFLWTEFAKYSRLQTIPSVLAAFRTHQTNLSVNLEEYFNEIKNGGFYILPRILARLIWIFFFPFQLISGIINYYKWRKFLKS
ncbi:MAG: glycosyltransferase [Candidatus Hodarchaeota archaeon]